MRVRLGLGRMLRWFGVLLAFWAQDIKSNSASAKGEGCGTQKTNIGGESDLAEVIR